MCTHVARQPLTAAMPTLMPMQSLAFNVQLTPTMTSKYRHSGIVVIAAATTSSDTTVAIVGCDTTAAIVGCDTIAAIMHSNTVIVVGNHITL
ncbi:hypothetical protein BHE74_00048880 [Ensete ventricosum]|nr:hypothetical protein BHE74_00048880 [Ensete ventricosum]